MGKLEDKIRSIIQSKIDDPDLEMGDIIDDIKNIFPLMVATEIIFDGMPGPDMPRFIEVEQEGKSVNVGEWQPKRNGCWVLRFRPVAVCMH